MGKMKEILRNYRNELCFGLGTVVAGGIYLALNKIFEPKSGTISFEHFCSGRDKGITANVWSKNRFGAEKKEVSLRYDLNSEHLDSLIEEFNMAVNSLENS